jgi:hypothetical protein
MQRKPATLRNGLETGMPRSAPPAGTLAQLTAQVANPERRVFPGLPLQLAQVRRFVARALDGCPVLDEAVLCVSELASKRDRAYEDRPGRPVRGCRVARAGFGLRRGDRRRLGDEARAQAVRTGRPGRVRPWPGRGPESHGLLGSSQVPGRCLAGGRGLVPHRLEPWLVPGPLLQAGRRARGAIATVVTSVPILGH